MQQGQENSIFSTLLVVVLKTELLGLDKLF